MRGKIDDVLIRKLVGWRHSGFSVYRGSRIVRDDQEGQEALARYIIRNAFPRTKLPSSTIRARCSTD
jgi:hypothetical protein